MANGDDSVVAAYRAAVERRVREQIDRHLAVNPNTDRAQMVDLQMRHEREGLERLAREHEDQGKYTEADFFRALIEWLPQLAQTLRRR
jgi:hypothetical protein